MPDTTPCYMTALQNAQDHHKTTASLRSVNVQRSPPSKSLRQTLRTPMRLTLSSLGGPTVVRAILDACSEITIMSMRVAKRIGAPLNSANIDIRAIGGGIANRARQTATIFIYPDGQSSPVTCP
ncbi:hypothetical protein TKK_0013699 [Trichogramma kaykai]